MWIRQAISRSIAEYSRTIHISVHVVEIIYKIKRIARRIYQEQGIEALPDQIAAELGLPRERVLELLSAAEQPVSLDAPMADDEQYHLADMLEDVNIVEPADQITHQLQRSYIEQVMTILNPRERIRQIEVKALRKLRYPERYEGVRDLARA